MEALQELKSEVLKDLITSLTSMLAQVDALLGSHCPAVSLEAAFHIAAAEGTRLWNEQLTK